MVMNLVADRWSTPKTEQTLQIFNPATGDVIGAVPVSGRDEVDRVVAAAVAARDMWADTPVMERTRLMFAFKSKLEEHVDDLAAIVTRNHGKTLDEARGEVRRGIEVVDFACGAPTLLQGRTLRNVSGGVDQDYYRFPLGVVAGVPPFNFPVMIPLWMFPLAVVAGNTFVLKPSERTPLAAIRLAELFLEAGFPKGVLNLVHGAGDTVQALIEHPEIRAISFVGSEPVARRVYQEAAKHGKRVQALGGAKNHVVIMPDADPGLAIPSIVQTAFGNAGERCLAGSVAVMVGAASSMIEPLTAAARQIVVGAGDQPGIQMGPVINAQHRDRVVAYIERGAREGAKVLLDGRSYTGRPGFFVGPTILDEVAPSHAVANDEIFGPVLSVSRAGTLEEAIAQANRMSLGNMAVIFTASGRAARAFREGVHAGMVGINVPVAQPFAFYPFSGWKGSFYGDLHAHGTDGIEFFTRKKVVVSRWS